jgi:outer membrane protein OmpA-like peptidoglycan-associated protein
LSETQQEFTETPRKQFVDDAAHEATAAPRAITNLDRIELAWARANPQGLVETPSSSRLVLANFEVGRARLKPEHLTAIKRFLALQLLAPEASTAQFFIVGHTSATGDERSNLQLSRQRADAVARFIVSLRFPPQSLVAEGRGERDPADSSGSSAALARNRRAEITITIPEPPTVRAPDLRIPAESQQPPVEPDPLSFLPMSGRVEWSPPPLPLGTLKTPYVIVQGSLEGRVRIEAVGGRRLTVTPLKLKGGSIDRSAVETQLVDGIRAKFNWSPTADARRPSVAFQFTDRWLKPEIEAVIDPLFPVVVTVQTPTWVPITMIGEGSVSFNGRLKFKVGPGEKTLERFGVAVGAALGTAGVVALGTVVGTAALTIAFAEMVDWAREEGMRRAQLLAVRDGFAARMAFDVTGRKQVAELNTQIAAWKIFRDRRVRDAAINGYEQANAELDGLNSAGRDALLTTLGQVFGSTDFTETQRRIFQALGGTNKEPDTLTIRLDSLRR